MPDAQRAQRTYAAARPFRRVGHPNHTALAQGAWGRRVELQARCIMLWTWLRPARRAAAGTAAGALAGLLLAAPAVAAPPGNDAVAAAQPLAGASPAARPLAGAWVAAGGSNVDATLEPGEGQPFGAGRSVWYSWTAPAA